MVDGRTNSAKSIIASLRSSIGESIRVFDTEIPHSVRAAESSLKGKSIFAHDKGGKVAAAYESLTKEVMQLEQRTKIDLGLTGYDELFMSDAGRAENRLPKIYDIPLSEVDDFTDHPL